MPLPIASTRGGGTIPGFSPITSADTWTGDMAAYAVPKPNIGTTSATSMVADPLQANISAAPALQRLAEIVNSINQKAWLSAPGRQAELANINRWQAGELDPSIYAQEAGRAAQVYGGAGFGVDSPAWQAAVQRALVTNRQALQEKGAEALDKFYSGMPTADVAKYTVTPGEFASAQDAARARQLELAQLQQKGALEVASLNQSRALQEQELALKQQEFELARAKQAAQLAAQGFTQSGTRIPYTPSYSDWITQGYSRPTSYRRY